ncbi:hypothetical protein F5Y03DRAFT_9746 [Xylaria venustula]|nr:hypothetical protein F5Y03DRAFT_9746 [Xylaria venustula]
MSVTCYQIYMRYLLPIPHHLTRDKAVSLPAGLARWHSFSHEIFHVIRTIPDALCIALCIFRSLSPPYMLQPTTVSSNNGPDSSSLLLLFLCAFFLIVTSRARLLHFFSVLLPLNSSRPFLILFPLLPHQQIHHYLYLVSTQPLPPPSGNNTLSPSVIASAALLRHH